MKTENQPPLPISSQWNRRDFLRAGACGAASVAVSTPGAAACAAPGFGRARSCLLVFLAGGPSHLDTFDPKPDAPAHIRGAFAPIATRVPGLLLSEHLPRLARLADRLTIVRSMTHDTTDHARASYQMLTGRPYSRAAGQAEFLSRDDDPHIGSSLAARLPNRSAPEFVVTPGFLEPRGPVRAGQHAGRLAPRLDPVALPCDSAASQSPPPLSPLPVRLRERYGDDRFGQSVLLGRHLITAGVRFVQVNWSRDFAGGWDRHAQLFPALATELLPRLDRALSALLEDLSACGLLDETLVVVAGEFGRSPNVSRWGAGRDHWPAVFSVLLAGAGLPGGQIHGASDRHGAQPRDCPMTPGQLIATICHALGVDPASEIPSPAGSYRICEEAPRLSLWGGPALG